VGQAITAAVRGENVRVAANAASRRLTEIVATTERR
jgi:hypothetical protein